MRGRLPDDGPAHRTLQVLRPTNLDAPVPAYHFYRQLEAKLDLSFVRDLAHDCYGDLGRPSIDPVVSFKLHLIAFLRGHQFLAFVGADRSGTTPAGPTTTP